MPINRRHLLTGMGAGLLATGTPGVFTAHAAQTSGYKALVCLFLFGGMDSHDVILPYDTASYDGFADIRQTLLAEQGASRARDNLLSLNAALPGNNAGRQLALPPEMPRLKQLFDQGNAAVIGNVGPLIEPTTLSDIEADRARLPRRLYSHNDQQSTWMAGAPEGAQFGWGGLFADAMIAAGANLDADFTSITATEASTFLVGRDANPYRISSEGAPEVELLERVGYSRGSPEGDRLFTLLDTYFRGHSQNHAHILQRDLGGVMGQGYQNNQRFSEAFERSSGSFNTQFPRDNLGRQLQSVANTIAIRGELRAARQIFFVGIGGFDTHSGQAQSLPARLATIDAGVASFYSALSELGLQNDVTLFTASDFGRTLAVNGDGTDHGWGGHQIVVGGGVNGGLYGAFPQPELGHEQDAGGGRLIPQVSVEQYASTLGGWFGLNSAELDRAMPQRQNFDLSGLDFLSRGNV